MCCLPFYLLCFPLCWVEHNSNFKKNISDFFTGSLSGDSLKKEKLISSYSETMPLKTETGNSYCELFLKTSTTKNVFDYIIIDVYLFFQQMDHLEL